MSTTGSPKVSSTLQTGNDADTYGWDTTFAISFANANKAIAASWAKVSDKAKKLSQIPTDSSDFKIDAVLGPWQLTEGGDGKNIRMACPLVSGRYAASGKSYDFEGKKTTIVIEVGMEWVPDPGQFSFVINSGVDDIKGVLDTNKIPDALTADFKSNDKPLSAQASVLLQKKGLEWLITDGTNNFYLFLTMDKDNNEFLNVYQFEKGWSNNLKLLAKAVSEDEPAVSIITIADNPTSGVAAAVLSDLVSLWFNTNVAEFNHVFAAIDLDPLLSASDKYAWIKPTATSYAVTDQGTLDTSILGVLSMTTNNPVVGAHQVSPFAIPSGGNADAGFLISGPMFLKNMLLAGARAIFNNAPESSFLITNDGLTVANSMDLIWGKFMMDEKKKGSVPAREFARDLDAGKLPPVLAQELSRFTGGTSGYKVEVTSKGSQWLLSQGTPNTDEYILSLNGSNIDVYLATAINIAKGQFKMNLVHTYVEIEFIDLKYSYSSDFDVHVNYTEQVQLNLRDEQGKKIFWFDQILKNMVVSVTKTQAAITREIVEGAVTAALSLVALAGPIIEGLRGAAQITQVTEDGGEAIVDAAAFAKIAEDNPEQVVADETVAAENASAQSTGKLTSIKAAFNTPKWKFVGSLAALAGAIAGLDTAIDAIIEAAAKGKWEQIPGFDLFAQQAIAPYTFPNVDGFDLVSSALAGSLQIGLKVKGGK